jgi:hypothetical protein
VEVLPCPSDIAPAVFPHPSPRIAKLRLLALKNYPASSQRALTTGLHHFPYIYSRVRGCFMSQICPTQKNCSFAAALKRLVTEPAVHRHQRPAFGVICATSLSDSLHSISSPDVVTRMGIRCPSTNVTARSHNGTQGSRVPVKTRRSRTWYSIMDATACRRPSRRGGTAGCDCATVMWPSCGCLWRQVLSVVSQNAAETASFLSLRTTNAMRVTPDSEFCSLHSVLMTRAEERVVRHQALTKLYPNCPQNALAPMPGF